MVAKKERLAGIYSALITPMHADEAVNYDMLKQLVAYELHRGVEGFYCCGSSGEALLLTMEERKKILEVVLREVDGRVPVVSHVGTIRTRDAVDLAAHAKSVGADAVSMIPPYYYRFTPEEIAGYYEDVLASVHDFGVIIYNIPQFTGVSFGKGNAARLLEHPNVAGIKHTSQDLYGLERMKEAYPDKCYLSGFDEMYLPALAAGADAAIGTTVNLYPELFLGVREAYNSGRMEEALQYQRRINDNIEAFCDVGIFNAVKYAFRVRGLDCGVCRSPFRPLTARQEAAFSAYLKEHDV